MSVITIKKFKMLKSEIVTVKGKQIEAFHFSHYKSNNDFTGGKSHVIELVTFSKRTGELKNKIVVVSPNNDKKYNIIDKFFKL